MRAMATHLTVPTVAAFYLPQFHPIPENDAFWGRGFTEWRNVVQARPMFPGHEQPRLPADLGFYDLRVAETQYAQAALAREHGIGAFCYYHYWFNGQTVLGRPLEQMRAEKAIEFPFFLCWANENWTRTWDGLHDSVLLEQRYSGEDDLAHIRWLLPALADDRYHRIDGKPVLLIYRARLLPAPAATTDLWRTEASQAGVGDLHICAVESLSGERGDPRDIGFDAAVEFQPDWELLGEPRGRTRFRRFAATRLRRRSPWLDNQIYFYDDVVDAMIAKSRAPYERYRCVTPGWDNTPRRRTGAIILHGSTPERYAQWLRHALGEAADEGSPLVFVNAWNEWAEGAYLEPDLWNGRAYLGATSRAIDEIRQQPSRDC